MEPALGAPEELHADVVSDLLQQFRIAVCDGSLQDAEYDRSSVGEHQLSQRPQEVLRFPDGNGAVIFVVHLLDVAPVHDLPDDAVDPQLDAALRVLVVDGIHRRKINIVHHFHSAAGERSFAEVQHLELQVNGESLEVLQDLGTLLVDEQQKFQIRVRRALIDGQVSQNDQSVQTRRSTQSVDAFLGHVDENVLQVNPDLLLQRQAFLLHLALLPPGGRLVVGRYHGRPQHLDPEHLLADEIPCLLDAFLVSPGAVRRMSSRCRRLGILRPFLLVLSEDLQLDVSQTGGERPLLFHRLAATQRRVV